jgi:hypothetical protein
MVNFGGQRLGFKIAQGSHCAFDLGVKRSRTSDLLHAMDMQVGPSGSLEQVEGLPRAAAGRLGSAWLLHIAAALHVDDVRRRRHGRLGSNRIPTVPDGTDGYDKIS